MGTIISSTVRKLHPSGYYASETLEMILKSLIHPSGKNVSLPADEEDGNAEIAAEPNVGSLKLPPRQSRRQNLISPIIVTSIYSNVSIKLTNLRLSFAI